MKYAVRTNTGGYVGIFNAEEDARKAADKYEKENYPFITRIEVDDTHDIVDYVIYYDRPTKSWFAYWIDSEGNQVGDAVFDSRKDWCLIYLGMSRD